MELNQYQFYTNNIVNDDKETELILEKFKELKSFKSEEEVRDFLKENWGIKDDIENFYINPNIRISAGVGKKYYNVTFEHMHNEETDIKSFNYTKTERSIAW